MPSCTCIELDSWLLATCACETQPLQTSPPTHWPPCLLSLTPPFFRLPLSPHTLGNHCFKPQASTSVHNSSSSISWSSCRHDVTYIDCMQTTHHFHIINALETYLFSRNYNANYLFYMQMQDLLHIINTTKCNFYIFYAIKTRLT